MALSTKFQNLYVRLIVIVKLVSDHLSDQHHQLRWSLTYQSAIKRSSKQLTVPSLKCATEQSYGRPPASTAQIG